ncbi:MAG TPA: DUF1345 domain-containing protein [Acidimicrobiales bacterium]|nr:DUF1345 domain-containing protein [Acidimicrobiales bacterium]
MTDYPPEGVTNFKRPLPAAMRLTGTLAAGAVAGIIAALTTSWQAVPLVAWDAAALSWLVTVWIRIGRLDAMSTSLHATWEDPARATADLLLLSASVASLIAVVLGVIKASSSHGDERLFLLGGGIVTIVVSWGMVHTLFTLRYAALYYTGPDGGVEFNEDDKPCYADFAYLAFTIGMTYQVSDTNLTSKEIRHTALHHALLSYVFGTVIIAATINLAAGLVR